MVYVIKQQDTGAVERYKMLSEKFWREIVSDFKEAQMKNKQTNFSDLSGWLKTLVVLGWIQVVISIFAFIIGFTIGFMGL